MHATHAQQLAFSPLRERYQEIRRKSLELTQPYSAEDQMLQSMPDASPAKWHLAHTTWFFETFVLRDHVAGYEPFDPAFAFLFNSQRAWVEIGDRAAWLSPLPRSSRVDVEAEFE